MTRFPFIRILKVMAEGKVVGSLMHFCRIVLERSHVKE